MARRSPDRIFEEPRLVEIYDALDPDRSDLDVYVAIADELHAHDILDVGCGTGTLALMFAERGHRVIGVDPAAGSLVVARAKPCSAKVRWIHGDATTLPPLQVDLATMTGNAAQAIVDLQDWDDTLAAIYNSLKADGYFVFETRDPAFEGWREWSRAESYRETHIEGVGVVETWTELTGVRGPLMSFRMTWVFASDGAVLRSDSTLRFRQRDEVQAALTKHGFTVTDVRGTPDRPGREFVFFGRRPPAAATAH